MRRILTIALAITGMLVVAGTAHAAVLSGGVTDPRESALYSGNDVKSFKVSYDTAGKLTASVEYWGDEMEPGTSPNPDFWTRAKVGTWTSGKCVTTTDLGLYDGAAIPQITFGALQVEGLSRAGNTWTGAVSSATIANRGFDCVIAVQSTAHGQVDTVASFHLNPAKPTISWAAPRNNQTISGVLHEGSDSCWTPGSPDIVRTELYLDGTRFGAQSIYPWGCDLDTRTVSVGVHTLKVRAFTSLGAYSDASIKVNITR